MQSNAGVLGLSTSDLAPAIQAILTRIVSFTWLAGLVTITAAGIFLILGLGEDDSKEKAKKIILYTAIGIGVVTLAATITNFIYFIVNGTNAGSVYSDTVIAIKDRIIGFTALAATVTIVIAGLYLILGLGEDASKDKAKKIILYTVIGMGLIFIANALATFIYGVFTGTANDQPIRDFVIKIIKAILNFLALIGTIMVIISRLFLIFSMGDEAAKDKAKKIITYTLIGLVIVFFARVIVGFTVAVLSGT